MTAYREILSKLFARSALKGVKLGLENTQKLYHLLGRPASRIPMIHIAGTNGKGSVAAKVAKGLTARFGTVGLFTSPHISTFRERISINQEMISEQDVLKHLAPLMALAEKEHILATFFELTCLLALKYFDDQGVGAAVIETGLGGRLDATNVITPKLSVITSIDFDHTEILGQTLDKIAQEKGGIIKAGIPVVLGPTASIVPVKDGSRVFQVEGPFADIETENKEIANVVLKQFAIPEKKIKMALTTKLPCRRQRVPFKGQEVILDVAHNPIGLKQLFLDLKIPKDKLSVLCALSKTKDLKTCLDIIQQHAEHLFLVDAPNGRCADPETLRAILLSLNVDPLRLKTGRSVAKMIQEALRAAKPLGHQLLVCGTFFVMSDARCALGIEEPVDPFELTETVPTV